MTSMIYFHGVAWRCQQEENEKEQSSRNEKGVCVASVQRYQKYFTFCPWRELTRRHTGKVRSMTQ